MGARNSSVCVRKIGSSGNCTACKNARFLQGTKVQHVKRETRKIDNHPFAPLTHLPMTGCFALKYAGYRVLTETSNVGEFFKIFKKCCT